MFDFAATRFVLHVFVRYSTLQCSAIKVFLKISCGEKLSLEFDILDSSGHNHLNERILKAKFVMCEAIIRTNISLVFSVRLFNFKCVENNKPSAEEHIYLVWSL